MNSDLSLCMLGPVPSESTVSDSGSPDLCNPAVPGPDDPADPGPDGPDILHVPSVYPDNGRSVQPQISVTVPVPELTEWTVLGVLPV